MLTKQNLEQMLNLLEITTLEKIDSKCRQDVYTYGQQPLLKYAPESLVEYACAIYQYILPHVDTTAITEEDYISKWVAPHIKAVELIAAKDYMLTLSDIVNAPEPSPEGYNLENNVYKEISAYIDNHKNGDSWYFYEGLNDFLTNVHSPLRWETVTDARILVLIAEVDAIRAACNKELEDFIGKYSDYSEKTETIYVPKKNGPNIVYSDKNVRKTRYRVETSKTTYGTELKQYRQLIQDRLAYYKLKPKTITLLKANKDQMPPADWAEISQALESKLLTQSTRKLITAILKAFRQAAKAKKVKVAVVKINPAVAVDANEVFISGFVQKLAVAYAIPVLKDLKNPTATDLLDDVYSVIDTLTLANTQGTDLNTVQKQQEIIKKWYSDFNNILNPLTACLEIALNKLSPEAVLSEDDLNHGAIKGILAFAKALSLKVLCNLNPNILDYTELAEELHHQIQVQTAYYTEIEPLPTVEPVSKVQLIDAISKGTAPILPSLFDLTKPIQEVLDSIKANAVTTDTLVVLSDAEVQSILPVLIPITDFTVKEMANMLTGQPSTPYIDAINNGDLIIHTLESDKYLKIEPIIREDGYAEYAFKAYNWDILTGHIYSLQKLLAKRPVYLKWLNGAPAYSYKLLPKDAELRKVAIVEAIELYENLLSIANSAFDENDTKALEAISDITKVHYYKDFIRIAGHRLASWVYEPEEYRPISCPPVDANGYEIAYEPNHINGIRHDNSRKNLKVELKQVNLDLRRTSRPVTYGGQTYATMQKYCTAFSLSYDYLNFKLNELNPGEVYNHKNRDYCLGADGWQYIAIDTVVKVPQLTYNGKNYATPKDFASDLGLDYEKIRQGLYRAKKKNKTEYKCKEKGKTYVFYLDVNGDVTKIV